MWMQGEGCWEGAGAEPGEPAAGMLGIRNTVADGMEAGE